MPDFRTAAEPSPESKGSVVQTPPNGAAPLLHSSEKMVAALLNSASQAILATDASGRIALTNAKTEEIFGYTRAELLGAPIEMLIPHSKRHTHERHRSQYFENPHARPMGIGLDLQAVRKDGTEFPVEVSLSYVQSEEGMFGIAFVNDISQRKNLEAQLLHSQKLEAVGRLAGGVAHDFNNMLTVIQGYNRMVLDELPPTDPLREFVDEISRAAERATAIIMPLLAFSRRQVIQPQVINLQQVVIHAEKMFRHIIGEDIRLSLLLAPDTGNIKADPTTVEQAIVNLVINARDAMPRGGQVTIETTNVLLDETYTRSHFGVVPGPFVMLAVSDTGQGMDAETKRRIFEPFFTTKEHGKGTGLGLSTVYGTVKQVGGDIWVYSEPGQGTTLKIYFPRVSDPPGASLLSDAHPPRGTVNEVVLVVEDEKLVRDLTVRVLRKLGYSVLAAANGEEAVSLFRANVGKISLVVTDVVMPDMSGRQVADVLLGIQPSLPVLYLSGYTDSALSQHGVLDSTVNFLPKPYSREALAAKIREILSRR